MPHGTMSLFPWIYNHLGYDPAKDFAPVGRVSVVDYAISPGTEQAGELKCSMQYPLDTIEEVQSLASESLSSHNHESPNMALGGFTPKQRLAMAA